MFHANVIHLKFAFKFTRLFMFLVHSYLPIRGCIFQDPGPSPSDSGAMLTTLSGLLPCFLQYNLQLAQPGRFRLPPDRIQINGCLGNRTRETADPFRCAAAWPHQGRDFLTLELN